MAQKIGHATVQDIRLLPGAEITAILCRYALKKPVNINGHIRPLNRIFVVLPS